tara:strand:- start:88 stop:537 length:450 start_codon:yes stop_codon:yes gene_type:complete
MRYRSFSIIIFLSILTIFGGFKFLELTEFDVTGTLIRVEASQKNSIYSSNSRKIPIKGAKIVAVKGKVITSPPEIFIPINQIKSHKYFSITNAEGIFGFKLSPGEYTFFIVSGDSGYLNDFDGKGNYSSRKIESHVNDIILVDDRGILY